MENKLYYNSTNNIKLCGLLSRINDSDKIVVLCHGLNGNKTERKSFDKLKDELSDNNYNSFRFDFRGHGESSGNDYEMTIKGEIEDLESTLKMLRGKGYNEFVLLGASFGGSIISLLNYTNYSIKALVCWYSALDYQGTSVNLFSAENKKIAIEKGYYTIISPNSKREFKLGKNLFEEIDKIVPYKKLIETDLPILFVHGTGDSMIPHTLSEKVSALSKNSKLILVENAEHCFSDSEESLIEASKETINFIKSLNW